MGHPDLRAIYVAHALVRTVLRLFSTPGGDTSVDAARLGACATKAFNIYLRILLFWF